MGDSPGHFLALFRKKCDKKQERDKNRRKTKNVIWIDEEKENSCGLTT
jgi:hypothetical protein